MWASSCLPRAWFPPQELRGVPNATGGWPRNYTLPKRPVLSRLTLPGSSWSYHLHLDAADLVELAAFVVSPDATAQTLPGTAASLGLSLAAAVGGLP